MFFAPGFCRHQAPGCVHEGTLLGPSWSVAGVLTQSAWGKSHSSRGRALLGLHVPGEPVQVRYPSRIQGHSDEHPTLGEHLDGVVDEALRCNELQP